MKKHVLCTIAVLIAVIASAQQNPASYYDELFGPVTINPCTGLMNPNEELFRYSEAFDGITIPTKRINLHCSQVFDNECIADDGSVINEVMMAQIHKAYDPLFDNFKISRRYIVRLLPMMSQGLHFTPYIIDSDTAADGKLCVWYPSKLHDLMLNTDYPPTVGFDKGLYLSVVDWRNELLLKFYESFFKCFKCYLDEEVKAPKLKCATDAPRVCRRGDFIFAIEMGFMGPWGEGSNRYYKTDVKPEDFIRVAELYKKYFSEYQIITPTDVYKLGSKPQYGLFDFYVYLMTTTYGNQTPDADGLYSGKREFGLFLDHIASKGFSDGDFNVKYKDYDFHAMARKKHLTAPYEGELTPYDGIEGAIPRLCANLADLSISCIGTGGLISNPPAYDSLDMVWARELRKIGYRYELVNRESRLQGNKVKLDFSIVNSNACPCYDSYWDEKIIIRDKANGECLKVIDINDVLDVKGINTAEAKVKVTLQAFSSAEKRALKGKKMELFLRIEDSKHINENMFIVGQRNCFGEYKL